MNYAIVVVGGSRGGTHALARLLRGLPPDFPLPLAAVLHRDREPDEHLVNFLQQNNALRLSEAEEKQAIDPAHVYLAPADYHLLAEDGGLALSTEAPVNAARPSIDVLFESAAEVWRERTIGLILSGTGSDGAGGLARIKSRGGLVIVQDPADAEHSAMPKAAIAACAADQILPLRQIAPFLAGVCPLSKIGRSYAGDAD